MALKRRQIRDDDLAAVADLLARGFPGRSAPTWRQGLERQAARIVPEGQPRFGLCLENDGAIVGAVLLLFSAPGGAPRCNLSSWYVDPAFRIQAAPLLSFALKNAAVTYLNVSPAPNTWPTIEAQGFRRLLTGRRLAWPWLAAGRGARVRPFDPARDAALPEAGLLADHAALGCLCLVASGPDGDAGFVFAPVLLKGMLPLTQLVWCRDMETFGRAAGPLGRALLRRGRPLLMIDGDAPVPGCPGVPFLRGKRIYARGPHPPERGDIAYTEGVVFGA
jgi:hypothetical protein